MRGLLEQAHRSTNVMFHKIFGNPIFSATMSRIRFKFLIAHIWFDDHITRPTPWQHDRFAAFREIFGESNKNCGKFLVPNDFLSLDETLYPTRTQISFKQFNPSEPAKYGMLYKSINACSYPFTFSTAVYPTESKAELTSYYTPGTSQTIKYLIQNLECHTNLVRRNISYDRLYTSIPMAQWLLDRRITSVGTLQSNRKGIPAEIKEIKDRETNSYEIYWEKDNGTLNLHSYVVKTKSSGSEMFYHCQQYHRLLQLQKMTTKASPLFTTYTTFQKTEQTLLIKKWGSTAINRNQSAGL